MNSPDMIMANRFLDGELSPIELKKFEARLMEDEELAGYLADLEGLGKSLDFLGIEKAPEVLLPDGAFQGLKEALTRRRPVPAWPMLAAGSLAALLMIFLAGPSYRQDQRPVEPVILAEEQPAVTPLRLVYFSREAHSVSVVGNFNGWKKEIPLYRKGSSNYWFVEMKLEPGEYKYVFLVDGRNSVVDVTADYTLEDDYGSRNSVLRVGL